MRLYLIRHGETEWNSERRAQGQSDIPLNKKGIELAEVTAEALKDVPFDYCVTSPLKRARKTAEIMVGDRDIPIIEEPRIKEICFGEAEGKRIGSEFHEVDPAMLKLIHMDPWNYPGFPNGESIEDVVKRATEVREELTADPENKDKTILVSMHGCVLRAFLNGLYDDPSDFWQHKVPDNCSVTIVDINDGKADFIEKDKIYYDSSLAVSYFEWKD